MLAVEFGLHPYEEILDVLLADDNGLVVFDRLAGLKAIPGDAPVLVEAPVPAPRRRRLPDPRPAPRSADVRAADAAFPSARHGEVVVTREGGGYLVCWRPDSRHSRSLPVLSMHTVEECALAAARKAARDYDPGQRLKSARPRDYQRKRVYRWEFSFPSVTTSFGGIEEAREFAREICEALGVPAPEVSLGGTNLKNNSYHSVLKGVVLQADMLDSHTVLHELAHHVVKGMRGHSEPGHGPRFAGVLAGILTRFAGADLDEALARAREMDVDVGAARHFAAEVPNPRM